MAATSTFHAKQALLDDGWQKDVLLRVDAAGRFCEVRPNSPYRAGDGSQQLLGPVLPGVANLHSHAFQRAMAGLTERAGQAGEDNFWTWREVMYRFVAALDPDAVEAIATWLYIEMARAGYTTVVEFHYLHHDFDGRPYADSAELNRRIMRAATRAGIALVLLPVFYAHSGFGGAPPTAGQRRFIHRLQNYAALVEKLATELASSAQIRIGVAAHSLRAVTPEELRQVIALASRLGERAPIHIHIAEQEAEVAACQAALGTTPVAWLLDNAPVDERFCLVHATHMTEAECVRLAQSRAVAGLCPTTEANLGDGVFDGPRYLRHGGRFGVGSDSNVALDPFEELRLFEYGQRLFLRRRNVLGDGENRSVGGALFRGAYRGGAQAAGERSFGIAVGARADLIVLDGEDASLVEKSGDQILDAAIFGPGRGLVRDVVCGGRFIVEDRVHQEAAAARAAYVATLGRLR